MSSAHAEKRGVGRVVERTQHAGRENTISVEHNRQLRVKPASYIPSKEGTMVYFMCKDVQNELDRIEAAGGQIYQAKKQISPEYGYMGVFIDSEGNRVALHSMQ